jgi:hypothetical protein
MACNIILERNMPFFNGIFHAPKSWQITVTKQKRKNCNRLMTTDRGGQKNCNGKQLRFFFALFSTSAVTTLLGEKSK